jgi:hypothetical protein
MKVANCSVRIPQGKELETGHVVLQHGQQYSIELSNSSYTRYDAVVSLDGDQVGTYRLNPLQVWDVEHPADSQQRFTFYAASTAEAAQVGESVVEKDKKGLLEVIFYPEKVQPVQTLGFGFETRGGGGGMKGFNLGAGVSGLSGHSDAQYRRAEKIVWDFDNAVTITLRLVTGEEDTTPQPFSRRAERMRANPVPPAVA